MEIVAVQGLHEYEYIKSLYPEVNVVTTTDVSFEWSKKNNPSILDMIKLSEESDIILINSDIELKYSSVDIFNAVWVNQSSDNIYCGIRYDVDTETNQNSFNAYGIDVYRLPKGLYDLIKEDNLNFYVGLPGWDYWLIYKSCYLKRIPLKTYFHTSVEHLCHEDRWNKDDYEKAKALLQEKLKLSSYDVATSVQRVTQRFSWTNQNKFEKTKHKLKNTL